MLPSRGFTVSPTLEPHRRHGTLWSPKFCTMQRVIIFRLFHTLQRLHGLPSSIASPTARHPLEPKILSHAEDDNFSPNSYPPEASGYVPSGGDVVGLILSLIHI